MQVLPKIKDSDLSEVKEIYRRYYRGKWYKSETMQPGYTLYYYATKVRIQLYYRDKERAQRDADAYNKKLEAYLKGRQGTVPDVLTWEMFRRTEVHNEGIWWHDNGSWLYAHGYDYWDTSELLRDDMNFQYDDFYHTTRDFFGVLFTIPAYVQYELGQDKDGEWHIYHK